MGEREGAKERESVRKERRREKGEQKYCKHVNK